jgi:cobyrinic acid a,c-diamide synthase
LTANGLILAAPASGSGKTLLTAGLLHHLRTQGVAVAAAKAGPDYIDPTFHSAASGRPCLNLDVWAMRPATLAGLVASLARDTELVLCEGVMGLFDGTGPDGEAGSTAALARLTGWPVVLVVDARHQGASVAALVAGFAHHDPVVPIAGVIFNRVSGPRHRELLEAAMARHLPNLPCLGCVPHDSTLALQQRHLGLVPAGEADGFDTAIMSAAGAVAAHVDVTQLLSLARPSMLAGDPSAPMPPLGSRIAVARDDAFAFTYPAVLDGWQRAGVAMSFFSPLANQSPDPSADAAFLPGGYPELHAGRIAAAARFLDGLRKAGAAGKPIYGECGGYMVLGESLIDAAGNAHRMAGLLPHATSFAERRLHLGYRLATLLSDCPLGPNGALYRAHEFHYAVQLSGRPAGPLFAVTDASGRNLGPAGSHRGSVFGSFIHLIDRADSE